MSSKPERVMVFVDGSNLYHGLLKTIGKINIDLTKLAKKLCGNRKLIRIYYYNAPLDRKKDPEKYKSQQKWFEKLRKTPNVSLILVKLINRKRSSGEIEYFIKGDDIHIAVDMIKFAYNNAYDTAILVSGDGDFYPAVEVVKDRGKRVENAYFKASHSFLLRQKCDKSIRMDGFIKKCLDRPRQKTRKPVKKQKPLRIYRKTEEKSSKR